jgi:hypothetical protein
MDACHEALVLTCWSCPATFLTQTERANHHLDAHERPLPVKE